MCVCACICVCGQKSFKIILLWLHLKDKQDLPKNNTAVLILEEDGNDNGNNDQQLYVKKE